MPWPPMIHPKSKEYWFDIYMVDVQIFGDQRPTLSTEFAQNANAHNDQFLVTKKAKGRLSAGPTSSMDSESPRRTKARPVRQWSETGRHIRRYPLSPNAMSSPSYDPSSPALHEAVSAWFLGPQAENADLLKTLFNQIVDSHTEARISYHPEDGAFISEEIKQTPAFNNAVMNLREEFNRLSEILNEKSIPFYSPRYAGHMSFESSLPSILGWLATMLFNPNNVAFEASPITTLLELDAGTQICDMLGYSRTDELQPWGHITCDGTVSNIESMWAARNLKYYPIALREAMRPGSPLAFIANHFQIHRCADPDEMVLFRDLNSWELLNLRSDELLSIPGRLRAQFGITSTFLESVLRSYSIQSTGKDVYDEKYGILPPCQYLISSTKHYSWPKAGALVGIGSHNVVNVPVDENARMDIDLLREAIELRYLRRQAIYAVVAIIGSTEEGAVDSLNEIVAIRDEYRAKGMFFLIHADAAWGGYFASMIREKPIQGTSDGMPRRPEQSSRSQAYVPSASLKEHTLRQIEALREADSVTIDPHKSGYCPYPAGGLCYRDGRMRYLLTWTAPYLNQGRNGENIGIYGVEGSKPGAAAASVYLHHTVVGLHKQGHGSLLGEVSFSCARISAHWASMSDSSTPYLVVPLNRLRSEPNEIAMEQEKQFIRQRIIARSNNEIVSDPDPEIFHELRALGSDLNINAFACNFRLRDPRNPNLLRVNDDVEEANYLNKCIFDRLSVTNVEDNPRDVPMYITSTTFSADDYGRCLTVYKERLGLETTSKESLFVLRNVVMSPFQAAANFVERIADIFRQTLIEEMRHVVARNTISPQEHMFTMHGTDKLFLVYRPLFHKANGRQQLILTTQMSSLEWVRYLRAREAHEDEIFTLSIPSTTIETIISDREARGFIYHQGTLVTDCTLNNISVLKNRSLLSKWRDPDYPLRFCPFYLYGSSDHQHIDHMLLKAPNAQLSAEDVELALDCPLSDEQLERGLLVYMALHERPMQPFGDANQPFFFRPGLKVDVKVYEDPFEAEFHGPGLAPVFEAVQSVGLFPPVATGTMTLRNHVFVDWKGLNKQDFKVENRISRYTEGTTSEEGKAGWRNMVFDKMDKKDAINLSALGKRRKGLEDHRQVGVMSRVATPTTPIRPSPLSFSSPSRN